MEQDRDIRKVVWAENRDEIFLQWFAEDCSRLLDAGFSVSEAKQMAVSLKYVRCWCLNPRWLFPINKLPKGYKWRDGQKFVVKGSSRSDGETYIFLPAGENLYIKGLTAAATHFSDYPAVVIKNYRSLTYCKIASAFPEGAFFLSSLVTFWHSQGLDLGYTMKCIRPMGKERK